MPTVAITALRAALEQRAARLGSRTRTPRCWPTTSATPSCAGLPATASSGCAGSPGGVARPAAQPRLIERGTALRRYTARGALGYVALARALDAELESRPPARGW